MKKMLIVLVALCIAAPTMAAVTLTKSISGKNVTIGFTDDGVVGTTKARAFALKITADNGAIITGVAKAAAHNNGAGYGIFPGTIAIDPVTGTVTAYNEPVERDNFPVGVGGQSALNTNQVIIAMGSLYKNGVDPTPAPGALVTVTVDKDCTLTITPETTVRGGVIAEDATALTVAPITAVVVTECMKTTAPEYAVWVAWGKPSCWCFKKQCRGDINGTSSLGKPVTSADLDVFKQAYGKADSVVLAIPSGICADLNHSASLGKRVTSADLDIFKAAYGKADASVVICPMTNLNFYSN